MEKRKNNYCRMYFIIALLPFLSTFFIFLLTGCSGQVERAEELPLVRSYIVETEQAGKESRYSGEVRGRYESQLSFQVNGKVIRRDVDLGSEVKTGDVLMKLDTSDLQQALDQSKAQVTGAEADFVLAKNNLERYQELYSANAVSKAEFERVENGYISSEARLQQTRAQLQSSINKLGYCDLRADSQGVITGINAEVGQVVNPGQTVVTLVQGSEKEVEINIPENQIAQIKNIKKVQVKLWALPEVVLEGKIREVSPVADKVTRTYRVRISIKNPPPELQLGMTASTIMITADSQVSTYIPLSAIYQAGDIPAVWIIKDGAVSLRQVKVGLVRDGQIEIVEGLTEGEVVVTAGVHKLSEGKKVRVSQGETNEKN